MIKIYGYLEDPNVYAIYDRAKMTLIISTNKEAAKGIIVII